MIKPKIELAQDVAQRGAAMWLLYRIAYWHPKATVLHDGHCWIAKDRQTWMRETKLSRNQIDRALARLMHLGLIDTTQLFFGKRFILHLRLTTFGQQKMQFIVDDASDVLGGEKDTLLESEKPLLKKEENTVNLKEIKREDCALPHAVTRPGNSIKTHEASSVPDKQEDCCASPKPPLELARETTNAKLVDRSAAGPAPAWLHGQGMNAVEVHVPARKCAAPAARTTGNHVNTAPPAGLPGDAAQVTKIAPNEPVQMSICALWVREVGRAGKYAAPLTGKQAGQLKMFARACPASNALKVLAHTVNIWSTFIAAAVSEAGAFNTPAVPEIGFLLKFVNVAVNLWQSKQASLAQQPVTPSAVEVPTQVVTKVSQEKPSAAELEGTASREEIMELLNGVVKRPATKNSTIKKEHY